MLIRISLIVAIVAGLAAAGLSFTQVREKMVQIMQEKDDNKKGWDEETKKLTVLTKKHKETELVLDQTKKTLETTQTELTVATAKATENETKAKGLASQLDKTKTERDTAQATLAQWDALRVTPDQVKATITELKKTRDERDTYIGENKIIIVDNKRLKNKLAKYEGDDQPPELPQGLKGSVVAVDPKYDFVVLDIGGNQGVLENGEMLINRNGQLVGKVKISSVEPTRSVANIMPAWKKSEVMEGDQVLY